jgi:hypothetical protein
MTIPGYAADLAARIPLMAQDGAMNNSFAIQRELEQLFKELTEQQHPELRSEAEKELEAVRKALMGYPKLPDDCWIGDNSTDDKVLWLVRRLLGAEATLKQEREENLKLVKTIKEWTYPQ